MQEKKFIETKYDYNQSTEVIDLPPSFDLLELKIVHGILTLD